MITKNVTITQVDLPNPNDKYPKYLVHYVGDDGKVWKIGNFPTNLNEATIKELESAKQEVGEGGTPERSLSVEKEGKFWNLVGLGKPESKKHSVSTNTSGKKPYGPAAKSGGYDSLGNQIGNTITNAVTSLGAGKTIAEYKARALELVLMGNEIREIVESGQLVSSVNIVDALAQDEVVEELGF